MSLSEYLRYRRQLLKKSVRAENGDALELAFNRAHVRRRRLKKLERIAAQLTDERIQARVLKELQAQIERVDVKLERLRAYLGNGTNGNGNGSIPSFQDLPLDTEEGL